MVKESEMEHIWVTHKNCEILNCNICEGGLAICSVCGLIEGSLTTECPGKSSYKDYGDMVYAGKKDFLNGEWIDQCSPASPAYYTPERIAKIRSEEGDLSK
jgi:hypothetical protein